LNRIYLDHNATTPIHTDVLKEMEEALEFTYGNPSTLYAIGKEAKARLEEAREKIAGLIEARPEEIFFTSGGTEANNLALFGICKAKRREGNHVITSKIEHDSSLKQRKGLRKGRIRYHLSFC